jgi:hypothetical protein
MTSDYDAPEDLKDDLLQWRPSYQPRTTAGGLLIGSVLLGALALGALAIGALAIGTLAIGRLAIGRVRLRRVEIGDLVVRRASGLG